MSPLATTPHARHYHHLGLDQGAKVVTRPTRPSSTPPDPDTTRSRHDPIPTRHEQDPLITPYDAAKHNKVEVAFKF